MVATRQVYKHEAVAIKQIRNVLTEDEEDEFNARVDVIYDLNHTFIIPFYGVCREGGFMFLVSQYAEKKSLDLYIGGKWLLNFQEKIRILCQASQAMAYLHSMHIVHGNIKPQNILLNERLHVRMGYVFRSLCVYFQVCHVRVTEL